MVFFNYKFYRGPLGLSRVRIMDSDKKSEEWSEHINRFYREEKHGCCGYTIKEFFSFTEESIPPNQWQADLMWLKNCLKWRGNARDMSFHHLMSQISALENAKVHDLDAVNQLIHEGCVELKRVDSLPISPPLIIRSYTYYDMRIGITLSEEQRQRHVFPDREIVEIADRFNPDEELPYMKQRLSDAMTTCQISPDEQLPYTKRLSDADEESTYKKQRLSDAMSSYQIAADNKSTYKKQRLTDAMTCQISANNNFGIQEVEAIKCDEIASPARRSIVSCR